MNIALVASFLLNFSTAIKEVKNFNGLFLDCLNLIYFDLIEMSFQKKTNDNTSVTVINTVTGQTLFRSYGRCIAEFLKKGSLVHLGLLDLSTCVGLRYGRLKL